MGGSYQVPPVEIQHSDLALYVISPEAQNEKGLLSVVFFFIVLLLVISHGAELFYSLGRQIIESNYKT